MGNRLSWPQFRMRVEGLLACSSRLARQLHEVMKEDEPDDSTG